MSGCTQLLSFNLDSTDIRYGEVLEMVLNFLSYPHNAQNSQALALLQDVQDKW